MRFSTITFENNDKYKTVIPSITKIITRLKKLQLRRVWRYQRDNHNHQIDKGQTTQWPKEKGKKEKQLSIKHNI